MKPWARKATAVLASLVLSASIFFTVTGCSPQESPAVSAATNETIIGENTITGIYATASPAVVEIIATTQSSDYGGYSYRGQGSGFVIDKDGHILTNNHVVENAGEIQIVFNDGDTETATVLGTDTMDDLAIVKVDASAVADITPLTLTDSTNLLPGQLAIALGSPYGLTNSISVGVISGLDRSIEGSSLTGMIQTDANIQPGNSGGPLLNSNGQVIGINTATEGDGTGIGFAVPSSVAIRVIPDLKESKQIERPWIGISGTPITNSLAEDLSLPVDQGVYVIDVVNDSPADNAGLIGAGSRNDGTPAQGGDIITAIDGQSVTSVTDLQKYLLTKNVGDVVVLTILRDGSSITVNITLAAWPADTSSTTPQIPDFPFPWGDR